MYNVKLNINEALLFTNILIVRVRTGTNWKLDVLVDIDIIQSEFDLE